MTSIRHERLMAIVDIIESRAVSGQLLPHEHELLAFARSEFEHGDTDDILQRLIEETRKLTETVTMLAANQKHMVDVLALFAEANAQGEA